MSVLTSLRAKYKFAGERMRLAADTSKSIDDLERRIAIIQDTIGIQVEREKLDRVVVRYFADKQAGRS